MLRMGPLVLSLIIGWLFKSVHLSPQISTMHMRASRTNNQLYLRHLDRPIVQTLFRHLILQDTNLIELLALAHNNTLIYVLFYTDYERDRESYLRNVEFCLYDVRFC